MAREYIAACAYMQAREYEKQGEAALTPQTDSITAMKRDAFRRYGRSWSGAFSECNKFGSVQGLVALAESKYTREALNYHLLVGMGKWCATEQGNMFLDRCVAASAKRAVPPWVFKLREFDNPSLLPDDAEFNPAETKEEIRRHFDAIVEFSELEQFIDVPVKHYSSGMYMRLGFAIAVHVDPEILLVDEVLAVGDEAFTHKCLDKFAEFRRRGKTILLVTHNLLLVERFCDEALWLDAGHVRGEGDPRRIVSAYLSDIAETDTLDVSATVLWWFGTPVPESYESRPLLEAFAPTLVPEAVG